MSKRMKKSEKLDLILLELGKVKRELARLNKHNAVETDKGIDVSARSARPKRPNNAPTRTTATKPLAKPVTLSKSVLVEAPGAMQSAGRIVSK
jgi:hypothetical protein